MKRALVLVLSLSEMTCSAFAIDCQKAETTLEKFICSDADMKKADAELNAAFSKLLAKTKDKEFQEALIKSQRRWLASRSPNGKIWADGAGGEHETDDKPGPETKKFIIAASLNREMFLESGAVISKLEAQRALRIKDGGGKYAGYRVGCWFVEPPWGAENAYVCGGTVRRQRDNRVCVSAEEWASGHTTEIRTVGVVSEGKLSPVATCRFGYAGLTCPGEMESAANAHWTLNPRVLENGELEESGFWKYDPDAAQDSAPWLDDCIQSGFYPPADQPQK
jgi:uncharacterized protein YecT (DUF1311 family)